MTASTEQHPLGPQHLAQCLALSRSANWNQNEADWRLMLSIGRGWGLTQDGTLVASTLVLPYGAFAWISMVLVLPEQRRKGHASRLLRAAIADLRERGVTPILDATPAGREVYRQEGFQDTWTFRRYVKWGPDKWGQTPDKWGQTPFNVASREAVNGVCPHLSGPHLSAPHLTLDREAFGADRTELLRALQQRLPQAALGTADGFVLGRDGREANQIGPLVASDEGSAIGLLEQALQHVPAPLYVDAVDHAPGLQQWLEQRGFEFQRPFTRMVHGGARAPGNEKLVYLVAGPELG